MIKIRQHILAALAVVGLTTALQSAPANPAHHALTDIVFLEPAKYTDVKDSSMGDHERTTYLDQLRDHLRDQARYFVPQGYLLKVTVLDIDMAGEFEPWRGPQYHDVRIVKDIYSPRIDLAFQLTDAEGNVVSKGQRELRDLSFMMKLPTGFASDTMRHEKALLDDWLRNEFPRLRKS